MKRVLETSPTVNIIIAIIEPVVFLLWFYFIGRKQTDRKPKELGFAKAYSIMVFAFLISILILAF
jgi:RsiW-degrading membrane proteinase PrsW (M82 family)